MAKYVREWDASPKAYPKCNPNPNHNPISGRKLPVISESRRR